MWAVTRPECIHPSLHRSIHLLLLSTLHELDLCKRCTDRSEINYCPWMLWEGSKWPLCLFGINGGNCEDKRRDLCLHKYSRVSPQSVPWAASACSRLLESIVDGFWHSSLRHIKAHFAHVALCFPASLCVFNARGSARLSCQHKIMCRCRTADRPEETTDTLFQFDLRQQHFF